MRKKRKLTEEHKKKIAESLRGKKKNLSPKAIENIRKANALKIGIKRGPHSEKTIEKIRKKTTGLKKEFKNGCSSWYKKGHIPSKPFKKGVIPWNKGTKGKHIKEGCKSNYRKKAFAVYENRCEGCFEEKNLHVHHIDGNRENSEKENLMILCNSCHNKMHTLYNFNFTHYQSIAILRNYHKWSRKV